MTDRESGYILASALGVLLAMSIVAAALISASANSLSQMIRAESAAQDETALRSALSIVASQLSLDTRRRELNLSETFSVPVSGREVVGRLSWETDKLDINHANIDAIEARLTDAQLAPDIVEQALSATRKSRADKGAIRLIDDIGLDREGLACAASMLTVFGGRTVYAPDQTQNTSMIGQAAAGSRLSIDLAIDGRIGLSVVVLMTGDPHSTFRVLDWRQTNGKLGNECDVAHNHT